MMACRLYTDTVEFVILTVWNPSIVFLGIIVVLDKHPLFLGEHPRRSSRSHGIFYCLYYSDLDCQWAE
jgi:hypothetical protein